MLLFAQITNAQERLTSYDFHVHHKISNPNARLKSSTTLLQLPFFDDFVQNKIYPVTDDNPNPKLWINSGAFVNFNYPINAPSYGCVTLDGLAGNGSPYSYVAMANGGADTLTSQPINLSKNKIGDSIYLSFFFEPEGNGDYPDLGDSLILEFYANGRKDTGWVQVWSHDGYSSDPKIDSFTQVIIPVADSMYLDSFFQFRFRNYATLSGNNDHWHIDYVKIDTGRRYNSFDIKDVAITNIPTRPLKNYFHMPWNQFEANVSSEMGNSVSYGIFNSNVSTQNIGSGCLVTNSLGIDSSYTPYSNNIPTDSVFTYSIALPYRIPSNLPQDVYCNRFVNEQFYFISPSSNTNNFLGNDTLNYHQFFTNYFSYDDGTAEKAWDVRGTLSEAALEYNLNIPDTLKAIQIHWAHMNVDQTTELINLMVWQSLDLVNSVNDVVLHTEAFAKPIYVDSMNGFSTYVLDTAQALPAGKFYIGFKQLIDSVNIGFDVNDVSNPHLYYKTTDGSSNDWDTTKFGRNGSIMMRPMFGKCIPQGTGVENIASQKNKIILYPNPTDAATTIQMPYQSNWNIAVFNMQGEMIMQNNFSENHATLSLNKFSDGAYFVRATDLIKGKIFSDKIIKQ